MANKPLNFDNDMNIFSDLLMAGWVNINKQTF